MTEPIRVAQIMGKMVGGGRESVVMNSSRHIDHSKVQFDFIVDEDSTLIPRQEIEALGGRIFIVPPYQHVFAYQKTLVSLFGDQGWRIVHSHENALSVFPLRAAKKAGVPVRIAHSHSTSGKGEHLRNMIKWGLRKFSRVYPTNLAACGIYAGEWLFGKDANFTVFPNAIELDRFAFDSEVRAETRQELGITDETFVVGHLGRFVKQKNHLFLLRTFAQLHAVIPQSMLVLAGSGLLLDEIKQHALEIGVVDSVLFLGQRNDAERLYQAFDVFTLPSLYEGCCVVGVEAQASGLPCLFSDVITREVGLTAKTEFLTLDVATWVNALKNIAKQDRTSRNIDVSVRNFDIESAAEKLTNWYIKLYQNQGV